MSPRRPDRGATASSFTPRARAWRALAVAACAALSACGGSSGDGESQPDGGACPNDLPKSCPADASGYAAEISAVIRDRCAPCHSSGGLAKEKPFTSYADVHAARSAILNQVYACKMPPPGAAPLASDERAALLGWLVCGAPDN